MRRCSTSKRNNLDSLPRTIKLGQGRIICEFEILLGSIVDLREHAVGAGWREEQAEAELLQVRILCTVRMYYSDGSRHSLIGFLPHM